MKKKALHKDFFIEIKKTYNRFISILLIVALGVAFFAGLRACRSDMELTADTYYDDMNLMDIRVISTLGITDDDIEALKGTEGVLDVEAAYTKDVLVNFENSEIAVKTYSMNETINQFYLVDGRVPVNATECMVDSQFLENTGYKIGDTIVLESGDDNSLSDTLKETTLTIVGSCKDARYLTFTRGNTTIGSGKLNSFIVLPKENYQSEVYQEAYVTVPSAKNLMTYSEEYDDLVAITKSNIEAISSKQLDKRYETLVAEPLKEIEDGTKALEEAKRNLADEKEKAQLAFDDAEDKLSVFETTVLEMRKTLEDKKAQLYAVSYGENDVNRLFAVQEAEISAQEEELAKQKAALEEQITTSEEKFKELEEELLIKEEEISSGKEKLESIPTPAWHVLDRNTIESYVSLGSDAKRIEAIAEVFPAIFFLVAALVCLTTMTRMVDEQRTQIGTLKALGYSKGSIARKYMLYAILATVTGSIIGILVGQKVFPYIIIKAYKILYVDLPYLIYPYQMFYAIIAGSLAVFCTTLATYLACYKELKAGPATLMRPVAPKVGKRILLERVTFIWRHLNFTQKATLRNLFRYKKRLLMTVIGIAGCMALLLVGFGIKDSIGVMSEIQYVDLWKEDATINLKTDLTVEGKEEFLEKLNNNEKIKKASLAYETSVDIKYLDVTKSANLLVMEEMKDFDVFYLFRDRVSKETYQLSNDGVILSEKLATMLNVSVGENITLKIDEFKEVSIPVAAITENYMQHLIYMSPEVYKITYGEEADYNKVRLINNSTDLAFEEQLFANLLEDNNTILSISSTSSQKETIDDMLNSLNVIVYVLIVCAGLLAFIVLYNLSNININERKRELASLKVLGFYDNEVNSYVMRENLILTLLGIAFGMALGIVLHRFVIITCEIELVMFGRLIKGISFIYSSLLTLSFSVIISIAMYFKLKKINMIESLKSVE